MDINLDTLVLTVSATDSAGALEDTIYLGDYTVVGEDVIGAPGLDLSIVLNPIATPLPINVSLGTIVLTLNLQVIYPYELGTGSEVCDMGTLLDYLRMGGRSLPASLAGSDDVTSWIDDMVSPNVGSNPATCLMSGVLGGGGESYETLIDGYQQSVDIDETDILFVPMNFADSDATSGITMLRYDIAEEKWHLLYDIHGGSPTWANPQSARICSTFAAYWGAWWQEDLYDLTGNGESLRLHVVKDGVYIYTDLYVWEDDVTEYSGWETSYSTMDIHEDGLIACMSHAVVIGGVSVDYWRVDVSLDFGVTWKASYNLPDIIPPWSNYNWGNLRVDDNKVIWICYTDTAGSTIKVFKSSDYGDSFSNIANISFETYYRLTYTVDHTGQYQYIFAWDNSGTYANTNLYMFKSSNYGVTWDAGTILANITDDPDPTHIHHSNQQYVVTALNDYSDDTQSRFRISSNFGVDWTNIVPPAGISDQYVDHQGWRQNNVYTECGEYFDGDTMGLLYSLDNGATWQVLNIDTYYNEDGAGAGGTGGIPEPSAGDYLMNWSLYDVLNKIKGDLHR